MDFSSLLSSQRVYFQTGATLPLDFRLSSLAKLRRALESREAQLLAALHADLRKPAPEAYASDIALVLAEIDFATKHLPSWIKPRRQPAPRMAFPSTARVVPSPLGVTLIMGPWNYPVQLLLMPLVGAIAAGNCAILKPSELSPQTAAVLTELITEIFAKEHVAIVNGDREVAESLLQQHFD